MEINPALAEAAKAAVIDGADSVDPIAVPGFDGMFVATGDDSRLKALSFFTSDGQRFAIGPLKADLS